MRINIHLQEKMKEHPTTSVVGFLMLAIALCALYFNYRADIRLQVETQSILKVVWTERDEEYHIHIFNIGHVVSSLNLDLRGKMRIKYVDGHSEEVLYLKDYFLKDIAPMGLKREAISDLPEVANPTSYLGSISFAKHWPVDPDDRVGRDGFEYYTESIEAENNLPNDAQSSYSYELLLYFQYIDPISHKVRLTTYSLSYPFSSVIVPVANYDQDNLETFENDFQRTEIVSHADLSPKCTDEVGPGMQRWIIYYSDGTTVTCPPKTETSSLDVQVLGE